MALSSCLRCGAPELATIDVYGFRARRLAGCAGAGLEAGEQAR